MANLDILRAALNAAIYQNYNHEISGSTLNTILNSMVDAIGGGYQFRGVATPETNPGTPDPNVFYIAAQVGTYSNFGLSVGENEVALFLWDGSWRKQNTGAASAEVVSQLGQQVIYDVTKNNPTAGPNNDGKWESLSALLSDANLSTLIPTAVRCGGMSIRFVQSSDNKYIQFRCIAEEFITNPEYWAICGNEVVAKNPVYIEATIDSEGKFLEGFKEDGTKEFAGGLQVGGNTEIKGVLTIKGEPLDVSIFNTNRYIKFLDFRTFTERISASWSGFISLEGVSQLFCSLHAFYGMTLYFYKKERSEYQDVLGGAEIQLSPVEQYISGLVKVPDSCKYFSFRVNPTYANEDYVALIKDSSPFEWRKNQLLIDKAKCISDSYLNSCSEPCLLYDHAHGIVYENYVCGDGEYSEENNKFGFAKFPLTQPERANYSIPFVWHETEISGQKIAFRDPQVFFLDSTTIRLVAPGTYGSDKGVWLIDQNLDGTLKGTCVESHWDSGESITYETYVQKLTEAGYVTPVPPTVDDKVILISSSHVQEHNGYLYATMNVGHNCPMIIRTDDNFLTIEPVKMFQFNCSYESALVIDSNKWYMVMRGTDGTNVGIFYTCSSDNGVTWGSITYIFNSTTSKPRGILYNGSPLFLIPLKNIPQYGNLKTVADARTCVMIIRGDANTAINDWKKELILSSKYGQNYGDIFNVGKDLYYAWSCDMVHLDANGKNRGKAQIMFTRIGDLDGDTSFIGDV